MNLEWTFLQFSLQIPHHSNGKQTFVAVEGLELYQMYYCTLFQSSSNFRESVVFYSQPNRSTGTQSSCFVHNTSNGLHVLTGSPKGFNLNALADAGFVLDSN